MTFRVPVEAGQILQFRRAVGELDATLGDDAVAPPTFLMAADHFDGDYARRPQPGRPWPGAVNAPAGGGAGFHAEQVFEYHRHPRAGDQLFATVRPGRTWEKQGERAGRLEFHETITEYRDASGELYVTATWVSVSTERVP